MNKKFLLGLFCLLGWTFSHASKLEKANLKITIEKTNITQNNTIQITQNNNCIPQPGSITIKNDSRIVYARNIQVSSTDINFAAYVVTNNNCPASLSPGASCTISFYTNAAATFYLGNVLVKGSNTNSTYFNINAYVCTPALTSTTPDLGLAVKPSYTGNSRQFTITNNTFVAAKNINIDVTNLPQGTTYTTTCGSTLNIGDSCTFTVTPGTVVSPGSNGSSCTTGSASNAAITLRPEQMMPTQVTISVLNYGCIYQSGFVFSVDDTQGCSSSPCIGGIGGKTLSLANLPNSNGLQWGSTGIFNTDIAHDLIPGIDDSSTASVGVPSYSDFQTWFTTTYPTLTILPASAFNACNALTDGLCNSANILAFYNEYLTYVPESNPPHATPLTYYGAGFCSQYTGGGFSNWYLPAICEFGTAGLCSSTTIDNIVANLPFLVNSCTLGSACLTGNFWSSTQYTGASSFDEAAYAWYQFFAGTASQPNFDVKNATHEIRCIHSLLS